MSIRRQQIEQYLDGLVTKYETLEAERDFLRNRVQERLAVVNAERQEILDEATDALARLNAQRVAAGLPELTLQQIRDARRQPRISPLAAARRGVVP